MSLFLYFYDIAMSLFLLVSNHGGGVPAHFIKFTIEKKAEASKVFAVDEQTRSLFAVPLPSPSTNRNN